MNKLRVLMAKPGLDGHWRGIMMVSRALRDAGMEVIYGGNMPPAAIAEVALQEDVHVVGLSLMTPAYMRLISETLGALKERGAHEIRVVAGGIIPEEDVAPIKEMGVVAVFRPGGSLDEVVTFFGSLASEASFAGHP